MIMNNEIDELDPNSKILQKEPTKKRWILRTSGLLFGTAIALVIAIAIGLLLITWLQFDDLKNIQHKVDTLKPIFTGLRCSILINIIIFWKRLTNWLAIKYSWDSDRLERILKKRIHVAIAMILVELIINQRIFDYLL